MTPRPSSGPTYEHRVGRFTDFKPGWWVFTTMIEPDGGNIIMGEVGPFASRNAAQVCADLAGSAEEITPAMVTASRRKYLTRTL